ncbi:MAG TPA: hypothetical protein VFP42_04830 [Acidimicrobiia bacterium]|nr:hypothetical protein [Acidimicrobiia bacterium]
MSRELEHQLSEYCMEMDQKQGALSFVDVLERTGELQVIPGRGNQRSPTRRTWVVAAVAAVAFIIVALAIRLLPPDDTLDPVDQQTTTTSVQPESEVIRGWPHTLQNPAGIYSWDLSTCSGGSCTMGFMHNGYGSGDVDIDFREAILSDLDDEGTPVIVAGYDGFYLRTGDGVEEWLVIIEGKRVGIRLVAAPGTSQADLDEAHDIIESIRTEPFDNRFGFRLVFTLTTDDWDSG